MLKLLILLSITTLFDLTRSEEEFHHIQSDGKSVMYRVSNVTMTWINSAKVIFWQITKATVIRLYYK
jgi:hypothetical protein